jgi:hypothetical protein
MLAASRRDPNFRGIDPDALGQLVKQVTDAGNAIQSWLNSHQPPAGVSSAGYAAAADVGRWVDGQLGMLTRRRNYALTHPDAGGGMNAPRPPGLPSAGTPGSTPIPVVPRRTRRRIVPSGAGPHIGAYPTTPAAEKAARSDAAAIARAERDHEPVPASVWKRLKADAADPDYTRELIERLGAPGVARLILAAGHGKTDLHVISEALGTASHRMTITRSWLAALLAESARLGDRPTAITVLRGAPLTPRAEAALHKVLAPAQAPRPPMAEV